jgi:hypothetical protein
VGTKVQAAEIIGKPSGETIDGTTGFDRIYGRGGYDNLSGNLGNDIIYPDGSTGLFAGGGGDDIILFRSACELSFNNIVSIDGGAGYDTLVIPIPLDQFRRLAPLVSITNIENYVVTTIHACEARCDAVECNDDSSSTTSTDSTTSDTCSFADVHIEPVNDLAPVVDPTKCKIDLLTQKEICEVKGIRSKTPADTPPGECVEQHVAKYCTVSQETVNTIVHGKPQSYVRRVFTPISGPNTTGIDPSAAVRSMCSAVAASPQPEGCYMRRNGNLVPASMQTDCREMTAMGGWPKPAWDGRTCTVTTSLVNGVLVEKDSCQVAGTGICVQGKCRTCTEFVECPEPGRVGENDTESFDPHVVGDTGYPRDVDVVQPVRTNPNGIPFPTTSNSPCLTAGDTTCRTLETMFDNSPVTQPILAISPCNWERQTNPANPNVIDEGAKWGEGDQDLVKDYAASGAANPWIVTKGDEMGFKLTAGATYAGNFKGAFADAPDFYAKAEGIFQIEAWLGGRENGFDVIKIYGQAGAELCDFGLRAEAKIMGIPMAVDEFDGDFAWPDTDAPEVAQLREECRAFVEEVNEARVEVNDRLTDAQNAIDFYRRYGQQLAGNGKKLLEIANYAAPNMDPWTSDELEDLARLPDAYVGDTCNAIVSTYASAADAYVANVQSLQTKLLALNDAVAQAVEQSGSTGNAYGLSFAPDPFVKAEDVEFGYSIGPFYVMGEIGGAFNLGASASLGMEWGAEWQANGTSSGPDGAGVQGAVKARAKVGLQLAPESSASLHVAVAAGVGNQFVNAVGGIRGNIELMSIKLPVDAGAQISAGLEGAVAANLDRFKSAQYRVNYAYDWKIGANVIFSALSGNFEAFARVKLFFFTKSWAKTLYDWSGIQEKVRLYSSELGNGNVDAKTTVPETSGANPIKLTTLINAPGLPKLAACKGSGYDMAGKLDSSGLLPWNPVPVTFEKIEEIRAAQGDSEALQWEDRLREQKSIWNAVYAQGGKDKLNQDLLPKVFTRFAAGTAYGDPSMDKPSDPRCDYLGYTPPPE